MIRWIPQAEPEFEPRQAASIPLKLCDLRFNDASYDKQHKGENSHFPRYCRNLEGEVFGLLVAVKVMRSGM